MLLWPGTAKKVSRYLPHESDEPYSSDSVAIWLAEEFVKSEPAPSTQSWPVKTVVGTTFREMVFDPLDKGQHVMLEVYAPWCGHCKKLAPEYEKFARKMAEEGREIVVAKLNGDANGIPYGGFEYTGYPTIFYLAPGSSGIVKVSERTAADLITFVRKNKVPSLAKAASHKEEREVICLEQHGSPIATSVPIPARTGRVPTVFSSSSNRRTVASLGSKFPLLFRIVACFPP